MGALSASKLLWGGTEPPGLSGEEAAETSVLWGGLQKLKVITEGLWNVSGSLWGGSEGP